MPNHIESDVVIDAPIDQVWHAVANNAGISGWFGTRFDDPFVAGQTAHGTVVYPGYEGLKLEIDIEQIREPELFSFRWHSHAADPEQDYSAEPKNLVEFRLRPADGGTRVTVRESGFDAMPADRAADAYAAHTEGWPMQLGKLAEHLTA